MFFLKNIKLNPNSNGRGWLFRPFSQNLEEKKCPCSHNHNTALTKQIYLFDTTFVMTGLIHFCPPPNPSFLVRKLPDCAILVTYVIISTKINQIVVVSKGVWFNRATKPSVFFPSLFLYFFPSFAFLFSFFNSIQFFLDGEYSFLV